MDQTQLRPHWYGQREFWRDIIAAHPEQFARTRDFERPAVEPTPQCSHIQPAPVPEEATRESVRQYQHLSLRELNAVITEVFERGNDALGAALCILKRDKLLGA